MQITKKMMEGYRQLIINTVQTSIEDYSPIEAYTFTSKKLNTYLNDEITIEKVERIIKEILTERMNVLLFIDIPALKIRVGYNGPKDRNTVDITTKILINRGISAATAIELNPFNATLKPYVVKAMNIFIKHVTSKAEILIEEKGLCMGLANRKRMREKLAESVWRDVNIRNIAYLYNELEDTFYNIDTYLSMKDACSVRVNYKRLCVAERNSSELDVDDSDIEDFVIEFDISAYPPSERDLTEDDDHSFISHGYAAFSLNKKTKELTILGD